MMEAMRSSLEKARPILVGLTAAVLLIVVFTGILLSMWYVPSSDPLRSTDGTPQTIVTSTRLLRSGPYTDTVSASLQKPQVAHALDGEPVVSAAQSSIRVSIQNAPYGTTIRRIHHWMSDVLLVMLTALLGLLGLLRTFETDRSAWVRFLTLMLIAVAGGWTGRILVDDVYAEISRRVMGHELSNAPLGGFITSVLGIDPGSLLLARTYSAHIFLFGVLGLLMITPDVRQLLRDASRPPLLSTGLLIALGVSSLTVPDWGLRDAVKGLAGWERVSPWWGIVPFRNWSQWLGSELAGFLAITRALVLLLLPMWHRKMPRRSATMFLVLLVVMFLVGLLFGN